MVFAATAEPNPWVFSSATEGIRCNEAPSEGLEYRGNFISEDGTLVRVYNDHTSRVLKGPVTLTTIRTEVKLDAAGKVTEYVSGFSFYLSHFNMRDKVLRWNEIHIKLADVYGSPFIVEDPEGWRYTNADNALMAWGQNEGVGKSHRIILIAASHNISEFPYQVVLAYNCKGSK